MNDIEKKVIRIASNVELKNFTDFDRLLISSNMIVTILGSILAFTFAYIPLTYIPLGYIPPFFLSLSIGVMVATAAYTKNIASSMLVGIFAGIGIVSPVAGDSVDFITVYIIFTVLLSVVVGKYSDKLDLLLNWVKKSGYFTLFFSTILLIMSVISNSFADRYWKQGVPIGIGGGIAGIDTYPILEILVFLGVLLLWIITRFLTKGQLLLPDSSAKTYKILGGIMIGSGWALSAVGILLYSRTFPKSVFNVIAKRASDSETLDELFTHMTGRYAVFVSPMNGYFMAAVSTSLLLLGVTVYLIGKYKGNIEGIKGTSFMLLLFPTIGTFFFYALSSYYIHSFAVPGGFYLATELFPLFFNIVYSVLFWNQAVAIVFYTIFSKLFKQE